VRDAIALPCSLPPKQQKLVCRRNVLDWCEQKPYSDRSFLRLQVLESLAILAIPEYPVSVAYTLGALAISDAYLPILQLAGRTGERNKFVSEESKSLRLPDAWVKWLSWNKNLSGQPQFLIINSQYAMDRLVCRSTYRWQWTMISW
jgi:hypothetical protein